MGPGSWRSWACCFVLSSGGVTGLRHLLLTLRYRGTNYHGFQVQQNALSVAQVVQDAVEAVFGARLDVKGCSRTDAGVHANSFALTLRTESGIPCDAVVRAMNVRLPEDIAVTEKVTSVPSRVTDAAVIVRTVSSTEPPALQNAAKSCVPRNSRAAASIAPSSSGYFQWSARPLKNGSRTGELWIL